jgi:hypothetical protein
MPRAYSSDPRIRVVEEGFSTRGAGAALGMGKSMIWWALGIAGKSDKWPSLLIWRPIE